MTNEEAHDLADRVRHGTDAMLLHQELHRLMDRVMELERRVVALERGDKDKEKCTGSG